MSGSGCTVTDMDSTGAAGVRGQGRRHRRGGGGQCWGTAGTTPQAQVGLRMRGAWAARSAVTRRQVYRARTWRCELYARILGQRRILGVRSLREQQQQGHSTEKRAPRGAA